MGKMTTKELLEVLKTAERYLTLAAFENVGADCVCPLPMFLEKLRKIIDGQGE